MMGLKPQGIMQLFSGKYQKLILANVVILLVGLTFYWVLWGWMTANLDMTALQSGTAGLVFSLQSWFGWPVEMLAPTVLWYGSPAPGFGMEIIALCLGIGELLFFSFLVLLYHGPKWRTKAQGLAIFLPIIFFANLIRLIAIYPLAEWIGIESMWAVHWHIWKWGMFAILMLFFAEWYLLFARNDIERFVRKTK
jgi:exosortase/archaeosortase family protein